MKNQAEIYTHLLSGGKLKLKEWHNNFVFLKDGYLAHKSGSRTGISFDNPSEWETYEEPKPTRKIELFECLVEWHKDKKIEWIDDDTIGFINSSNCGRATKLGLTRTVEVPE